MMKFFNLFGLLVMCVSCNHIYGTNNVGVFADLLPEMMDDGEAEHITNGVKDTGGNANDNFKRAVPCLLAGEYPHAVITVDGKAVYGVWTSTKRPAFYGTITGSCEGSIKFPDDKTYKFNYNQNTCTMLWDSVAHGNSWTKPSCNAGGCSLAGLFPHAKITMVGNSIKGKWTKAKRPNFSGFVSTIDLDKCTGKITFPDHKQFRFVYLKDRCTIYWDGKKHGGDWTKATCGDCPSLAGQYPHARLHVTGEKIIGDWITNNRINFYGALTGKCSGYMSFPDDRSFYFTHDGCHFAWEGQRHGYTWMHPRCIIKRFG